MDNLDDSENTAKISDSAYSNSCSNSQSRRSHSSKSTHSGSNSSGSSGYCGKPSTSGYSSTVAGKVPVKRCKEKGKKKKKLHTHSKDDSKPKERILPKFGPPVPVKEFEATKAKKITESAVSAYPDNVLNVKPRKVTPAPPASGLHAEKGSETQKISSPASDDEIESGNTQLIKFTNPQQYPESFSCVISMHDGIVMCTTPTITAMLGYPTEMWVGRSFLDFIHQRDRDAFASQITTGLSLPKNLNDAPSKALPKGNLTATLVCRIKRYQTLTSGFGVRNKCISYMPFYLKQSFKKLTDDESNCIYLVIQAKPLFSAFKMPYEKIPKDVPFVIRHSANGKMEFVDPESVQYLGYLPQDLVEKNALQLYHPHDLDYLQQIYETIVKDGTVPRGSPFRMMIQNGDFIKLETEWTSFVNPWSRKLEFVIGKHHVVEGPRNPDVFHMPDISRTFKLNEEDKAKTQCMMDNIVRIMNEVLTKPAAIAKQKMIQRCQDLAAFMETLIEGSTKSEDALHLEIQDRDLSYYERDSLMLGGISPHHDYNDSKSSEDTPVSYNQLNYNDNLQRFFDSHQPYYEDTISMSGENKNGIFDSLAVFGTIMSPTRDTDDFGLSPDCKMVLDHMYSPVKLTELMLYRHNAEMEKELMKTHRETRYTSRFEREKAQIECRKKKKEHLARCNASFQPTCAGLVLTEDERHGIKRMSTASDTEEEMASKQQCTSPRQQRPWLLAGVTTSHTFPAVPKSNTPPHPDSRDNSFLYKMGINQQGPIFNPVNAMPGPGYFPMYYAHQLYPPTPSMAAGLGNPSTSFASYHHPEMHYMYAPPPPTYSSPIMYTPVRHPLDYSMQQNYVNHGYRHPYPLGLTRRNYEEACKPLSPAKTKPSRVTVRRNRRRSELRNKIQGTKRDSGSSSAEASNRSVDVLGSSDCKSSKEMKCNNEDVTYKTDGESSYSSLYSSFFKTESGSAEESDAINNSSIDLKSWNKLSEYEDTMYSGDETYRYKKNIKNLPKRKMDPPWMEKVCATPELIYKYQIISKNIEEVLSSDRELLKKMEQPPLVNEQLAQLYLDMELEGVAAKLSIEEEIISSSSSNEELAPRIQRIKKKRRKTDYSKLVMIYEEDAPLPEPKEGVLLAPIY